MFAPVIGKWIIGELPTVTIERIENASIFDFWNYRYDFYRGVLDFFGQDENRYRNATASFRQALHKNPFHLYTLFSLARSYWMANEIEEANEILNELLRINRMNRNVAWDAGIFLLTKDDRERGMRFLRRYLILEPEDHERVFGIAYQFGIGPDQIAEHLVYGQKDLANIYFNYLLKNDRIADIEKAWKRAEHKHISRDIKLGICNAFVLNKKYDHADDLWMVLTGRDTFKGGIKNGGFEDNIMNSCLGWLKGRPEGFDISTDNTVSITGKNSAKIRFDGTANVRGSILGQIVPVEAGKRYGLKARLKTKDITTTNGVLVEIREYKCSKLRVRSDALTGTHNWKEIMLKFDVPDNCDAIWVSLRRDMSSKLLNRVSGDAWIDDVKLERLDTL